MAPQMQLRAKFLSKPIPGTREKESLKDMDPYKLTSCSDIEGYKVKPDRKTQREACLE